MTMRLTSEPNCLRPESTTHAEPSPPATRTPSPPPPYGRRRAFSAGLMLAPLIWLNHGVGAIEPPPPPPLGNDPPLIVDFIGTYSTLGWTFEGQVIDENPQGLVITFGGLLNGHHTSVNSPSGYFQYTAQIQGPGTVTAQTIDDHEQESNVAIYYLL
jgi:hypothetical protein